MFMPAATIACLQCGSNTAPPPAVNMCVRENLTGNMIAIWMAMTVRKWKPLFLSGKASQYHPVKKHDVSLIDHTEIKIKLPAGLRSAWPISTAHPAPAGM